MTSHIISRNASFLSIIIISHGMHGTEIEDQPGVIDNKGPKKIELRFETS